MSFATLTAMEKRHKEIRLLTSEVTGLKARIDEKVKRAEVLVKEIENLSLRDESTPPEERNK